MDAFLHKAGAVTQVWRGLSLDDVPEGEYDGALAQADGAVCGMLWDGSTLSDPPAPPPERRLIPKSVVQERVNDIGKLGAVMGVLKSAGHELDFARWFASDWPNVYADDPGMLALLAAVGCSAAQIVVITAPV